MYIVFAFLLLCSGCQSKQDEHELADASEFDLEAKYNTVQNSSGCYRDLIETEDAVLALVPATKELEGQKGNIPSILGYLDKEQDKIMLFNKDVSSLCSPESPSSCSGIFFPPMDTPAIQYYKGRLYYLDNHYDYDTDSIISVLKRCDIDGHNVETIYTFDFSDVNIFTGSWVSPFIQFHKNKVYIQNMNRLYYGDVDTLDIHEIPLDGIKKWDRFFIINDAMYVYAEEYHNDNQVHFNAVIMCDLEGNIKQMLYEDMILSFIDEENVFYYRPDYTEDGLPDGYFMRNRETNEVKRVADYILYNLKYGDTYLLDTSSVDEKNDYQILILNKDGDVLFKKTYTCENEQRAQIYTKDRYYVWKDGKLGYYKITEEGISDLVLLSSSDSE